MNDEEPVTRVLVLTEPQDARSQEAEGKAPA